jgi:hypothetical protein
MGLWNRLGWGTEQSNGAKGPGTPAGRLMGKAGRLGARALANAVGLSGKRDVEQLEQRQLLFTATVTADLIDPQTGLGTVEVPFGYVHSYLDNGVEFNNQDPQAVAEDFNDDAVGLIQTGRQFAQSFIVARHNIQPVGDFAVVAQGDNQSNIRWVRASLDQGEFFEFQLRTEQGVPIGAQAVTMTFAGDRVITGDASGLDIANARVTLLLRSNVVATFEGDALRNVFNGNDTFGTGQLAIGLGNLPFGVAAFDSVRVQLVRPFALASSPTFEVDDVTFTSLPGENAGVVEPRIVLATMILTGPVGASFTVRDLYGRDMIRTLALGRPEGSRLLVVDLDDNGIPDYNDGIGSITLSGVDSRTSFSVWGGELQATTDRPDDADYFDGSFAGTLTDSIAGLAQRFEQAGFGYILNVEDNNVSVAGLPSVTGSVIIGSPYVRPLNAYNPYGPADDRIVEPDADSSFVRPDQGVFVLGGQSIGKINIHGILHGASRISGRIDQFNVSYMPGSLSVEGDLGSLNVATDAGSWTIDPGFAFNNPGDLSLDPIYRTEGTVVVGRTAGEIAIAGRSLLDITVVGDLDNPVTRPARNVAVYDERESITSWTDDTDTITIIRDWLRDTVARTPSSPAALGRNGSEPIIFGGGILRNNTLSTAEWVGSIASSVRIRGELSASSPIAGEDSADVFAFAWDGVSEIFVQSSNDSTGPGTYFRIMDQDGRTIAAPEGFDGRDDDTRSFQTSTARVRPDGGPGTYYLVVSDPNGSDTGTGNVPYTVVITGMAPTTLGAVRTGGSSGNAQAGGIEVNALNVLSGSVGAIRVGLGWGSTDGVDATQPSSIFNTILGVDEALTWAGGTASIAGNLYAINTGGDIGAPRPGGGATQVAIRVNGDFGSLYTGLLPIQGVGGRGGARDGDVNDFILDVGGRIGVLDVNGGIGMDQDLQEFQGDPRAATDQGMSVRTGLLTGRGDIGTIRVGFHVNVRAGFNITTSPGSTIGQVLISQDSYFDADPRSGLYNVAPNIVTGFGSDVRFFDTPQVDTLAIDSTLPIIGGQVREVVDDNGSRISFSVANALPGVEVGRLRVVPIAGSRGVALAQVEVDLTGGLILNVAGTTAAGGTPAPVSIGRMLITGDLTSRVNIGGTVEVDVYHASIFNGLAAFSNVTPGGDIVALDAAALDVLEVAGNLGSTQTVSWGKSNIGLRVGVDPQNRNGTVGAPIGFPANIAFLDNDFNGNVFRPASDDNFVEGNAYLDDIGSPLDGRIDGAVIREGNVTSVTVRGSVGDIILQGDAAVLASVLINSDGLTRPGGFDGLLGSIYAPVVVDVRVGDGIASRTGGPLGAPGIFAEEEVQSVGSSANIANVFIGGVIAAANATPGATDLVTTTAGIGSINFTGARFDGAYINTGRLEDFWTSFNFGEETAYTGRVDLISIPSSIFFRSVLLAQDLTEFSAASGVFDASNVTIINEAGLISFDSYRNSTLTGDALEFRQSLIEVGQNLSRIVATQDMSDLTIDVVGDVTTGIAARNIVRGTINVDNRVTAIAATGDIRGSNFVAGQVDALTIGNTIASSSVQVAGELRAVTAANSIVNTSITVDGPNGRINQITAVNLISGTISATGPIASVISQVGDIDARIVTTTEDGDVLAITAGRDLLLSADISGTLGAAVAGRNVGRIDRTAEILARRAITTVTLTSGTLYSDIRSGGTIGTVTIGGAVNKPGQALTGRGGILAFERITSVIVTGDFGGDIRSFTGGIGSVAITNGSYLAGRTIGAFDGNVESVVITNGNLFGNIETDKDIVSVRVDGAGFGDVGVDAGKSQFNAFDARRNQLPPGVAASVGFSGPVIKAGRDILAFTATGSVFESGFVAGRNIVNIAIGGRVANNSDFGRKGSFFAAGDNILTIAVGDSIADAHVLSGVISLGADNRPGGIKANADVIKSGNIGLVRSPGGTYGVTFGAGASPGVDGVYGDDAFTPRNEAADDRIALGLSFIDKVEANTVANTQITADAIGATLQGDSRFVKRELLPIEGYDLDNPTLNAGTQFSGTRTFTVGSVTYTLTFSGPGQAFYDAGINRVTLRDTNGASSLVASSSTGVLDNFRVWSNDEASMGLVRLDGTVQGNSSVLIDGGAAELRVGTSLFGRLANGSVDPARTPTFTFGGDVGAIAFTTLSGANITARQVGAFAVAGDFGSASTFDVGEASLQALTLGTTTIGGAARGVVSVDRDAGAVSVTGLAERFQFRAGGNIAALAFASSVRQSTIAAGDAITGVTIAGEMFDSSISAGLDLGRDAFFEGTGLSTDVVSTGSIGAVAIGGNFLESDITVGYNRGADRFFGTGDDRIAAGRGSITGVVIGGTQVGSPRGSESYRIASNGTVGPVTLALFPISTSIGNFAVETPSLIPRAITVQDVRVTSASGIFAAELTFSEPMDSASLSSALSVSEVRGQGEIEIRLVEGIDYTLSYTDSANTLRVIFNRNVTSQNLPQVAGRPGPGVYRFRIDRDFANARLAPGFIDGDGDGVLEPDDDFIGAAVVGDAGDKLTAERITLPSGQTADLYAPANLNFVFDNPTAPDGLPDVNRTFTIRGFIGDHPDHDFSSFRFQGDVDLYAITLEAGQILRLGALDGSASRASYFAYDEFGVPLGRFGDSATAVSLPVPTVVDTQFSFPLEFLIKRTGRYFVAVGLPTAISTPGAINNPPPASGIVGDYAFTMTVFDDGDSGFTSPGTAGDGSAVVNAPTAISFAGADAQLGTSDDAPSLQIGDFTFFYNRGADGIVNTTDDTVTGSNTTGTTSTRNAAGRLTSTISSAIGNAGFAGRPSLVSGDVDIYHLNNRQSITPGTKMRATVRLAATGSDLGSLSADTISDNRGGVQFGLFDTTGSVSLDDASLVFSPTDFLPYAGTPNVVLADNGSTRYGYDNNGDFFIEFIVPPTGNAGAPGTFALYIQGVINSDYQIEVVTEGTGVQQRVTQNFFIETRGGAIDWLEAGGRTTTLAGFDVAQLGFSGSINQQPVGTYVLSNLASRLNSLFQGAGLDVRFSTNPGDFEFQPFSTIFLSATNDPINAIFSSLEASNFQRFVGGQGFDAGFVGTNPFGASQRSDPFNANREDDAVVFIPPFTLLGLTPSITDADNFVLALTGAVARRAGELMGTRITANNAGLAQVDPFAANSVTEFPLAGQAYAITDTNRDLSAGFDTVERTDFFLGRQRALSLLRTSIAGV